MAKATNSTQGRRPRPTLRRRDRWGSERATLGELIASAFEALGDAQEVTRVLSSQEMAKAIGKRIVFI